MVLLHDLRQDWALKCMLKICMTMRWALIARPSRAGYFAFGIYTARTTVPE